jgi:hypothetical protein
MGKIFNYLYLDDNDPEMREGDVQLINRISSNIHITTDYPCSWSQRLKQILSNIDNIDGIILDWELTNMSASAKMGHDSAEDIDFSAESLAEHLRVSAAQGDIKGLPIIVCSANRNNQFTTIRKKDRTIHDVFDLSYIKEDLFVSDVKRAAIRLYDLAKSYQMLTEKRHSIPFLLSVDEKELKNLDLRFVDELRTISKTRTSHDIINFFLLNFIDKEGPLISENILAARLGVDIEKCENEWGKLISILETDKIIYSGLLSKGWRNFWAFRLTIWWSKFSSIDLRASNAEVRVGILNEVYNLELVPAKKIKYCSSSEYWTICVATNRPINPIDGFLVGENTISPWLDSQYISGYAELEKIGSWKINVMDREHFKNFKKMLAADI